MSKKTQHQTLALAGVFQAAHMVNQIATEGKVDNGTLAVLLNAIFVQNPSSIDEVFDFKTFELQDGYDQLTRYFERKQQNSGVNPDTIRYFLSILMLSIKLSKDQGMMAQLAEGIKASSRQKDHFHITHESVVAGLAQLYKDSLSSYRFRIQVTGRPEILKNDVNADRIRALLLAGVRCGILWRQLGGSRWHLLFSKKKIAKVARQQSPRPR